MLRVLRKWSQRFLERRASSEEPRRATNITTIIFDNVPHGDLQELPKPAKCRASSVPPKSKKSPHFCANAVCEENDQTQQDADHKPAENRCACSNCTILYTLTECRICYESLQSRGVLSCPVCSNLMCKDCGIRVFFCPFCRARTSMERNRAVERLLDTMVLPCKNSSSGCRALLNADVRLVHEATCIFAVTTCPVGWHRCEWRGEIACIEDHLRRVHRILSFASREITVQIPRIRRKIERTERQQHAICLSCYNQLFMFEVILFDGNLKLSFTQLGYVRLVSRKIPLFKYGTQLNIYTGYGHLQGDLPFNKMKTHEVELNLNNLYPTTKDPRTDEMLKIDVVMTQTTRT